MPAPDPRQSAWRVTPGPLPSEARLLAGPGDVTGAGFAVGSDSPLQFSREYRRMFGAPPSRDALAPRKAAALP